MTQIDLFSTPAARSDQLLEGLNPQQRAAVTYRGPALLIVAGAGSGKTKVLTHRIAHLLANKEAWPSQILSITFTNKAAGEMRERVRHLLGEDANGMWLKTFHSACVMILRREAERLGHDPNFTIYDSGDSRALLKRLIKEMSADIHKLTPGLVASVISNAKNELHDAEDFMRNTDAADPAARMIAEIFGRYQRELKRNNAFDFDDLISETVFLFRNFPEVAAQYQRKFRHILVDEYQDTNHAQYALIRELTKAVPAEYSDVDARTGEMLPPASLTVVGDSDQSIYAFRGADIRNIVEFEKDFVGAKTILLEQNYRSTQHILDAANAVISNNFDRPNKNLFTDRGAGDKLVGYTGYSAHDEAQFIADEINQQHRDGANYADVAVFYRTNAQTRALEEIFIRAGIPYRVVGGTKFYERQEIKDAFGYLVAIANARDDLATRRILNVQSAASVMPQKPSLPTTPSATAYRFAKPWLSSMTSALAQRSPARSNAWVSYSTSSARSSKPSRSTCCSRAFSKRAVTSMCSRPAATHKTKLASRTSKNLSSWLATFSATTQKAAYPTS